MNRVCVVVPAHNEARLIQRCLGSVARAARACVARVEVIVAADSCTDGTVRVARAMGARIVEVRVGNVGRVRAAGCAEALREGGAGLWLAHTDADSTVPEDWIARQLRYADHGMDLVAGTVEVDRWQDWPAKLRTRYEEFYQDAQRAGRHHVHGANLGLSGAAYRCLGGFAPLEVGEDRALLAAAERAGLAIAYPTDLAVRTSGRRRARVVGGGFHRFLAGMADDPPAVDDRLPAGDRPVRHGRPLAGDNAS
jgi:glycosyltransferase involved in cell wall biosynthesis